MKNNSIISLFFACLVALIMMLLMRGQRELSMWTTVTGLIAIAGYHFAFYQTTSYLMSRYNYKKNAARLKRIENLSFKRDAIQFHMGIYGFGFCATATVLAGVFMYPTSPFKIALATCVGGIIGAVLSIWQSGLEPSDIEIHKDFESAMQLSMRVGYRAAIIGFTFVSIPFLISGMILGIEFSTIGLITIALASIHALSWWAYVGGGGVAVAYNTLNLLRLWKVHPSNIWDFLQYANDIILLRKVGGGYIFIHRYLLEYFAELETESKSS